MVVDTLGGESLVTHQAPPLERLRYKFGLGLWNAPKRQAKLAGLFADRGFCDFKHACHHGNGDKAPVKADELSPVAGTLGPTGGHSGKSLMASCAIELGVGGGNPPLSIGQRLPSRSKRKT